MQPSSPLFWGCLDGQRRLLWDIDVVAPTGEILSQGTSDDVSQGSVLAAGLLA